MKVGLIARAEDRGLGILTWEFHRHVQPERTLVINMGSAARGFQPHPERYPGAVTVAYNDGNLDEQVVRDWLQGLDVVFSAETFYDWRVVQWAREAGVATVCQSMPEFYRHWDDPSLPDPDAWWVPTPWLIDRLPARTRLVPVPVALDRWPECDIGGNEITADVTRMVHVAGHRAMGDRNGTTEVLASLHYLAGPLELRIVTQDRRLPSHRGSRRGVAVTRQLAGVTNYWDLYADTDVLVLPRRYGGLCLPVQEAMGAGLAVVMTDAEPQRSFWPVVGVPSRERGGLQTGGGLIPLVTADAPALARALDLLANNPAELAARRQASRDWARAHSWAELLPTYLEELAMVCEVRT
ncbi:MAG: glycosyltransferase domain-containing protein [Phage 71_18]|nr:MAG: glycosyltransferase domain-containing protein [Phage 71_18]